jgi:hypothetical protein
MKSIQTTTLSVAALSLLSILVAAGAFAAPAAACICQDVTFAPSSSSTSPITITQLSTTFTTGNSISYTDFGPDTAQYMNVWITGITPGWTVTITSGSTKTTVSGTDIIVGPLSGTGSFSYTITVTAPSTPSTTGQFTINSEPWSSSSSEGYNPGIACTPVTVYLKTTNPFPPPPNGVPQFPFGMALVLALAIPALLLVRKKQAPLSISA